MDHNHDGNKGQGECDQAEVLGMDVELPGQQSGRQVGKAYGSPYTKYQCSQRSSHNSESPGKTPVGAPEQDNDYYDIEIVHPDRKQNVAIYKQKILYENYSILAAETKYAFIMIKTISIICLAVITGLVSSLPLGFSLRDADEFSSGTISVGIIATDLEKSVDFYIRVIGMTRTSGFAVDEDFAKKSGLTGGVPFKVTVLKLKNSDQATEWKLMSFDKKSARSPSRFIQDDTGVQYITIFMTSMKPVLERIHKNNVRILSETPTVLDDGRYFVLIQDPDGTFIELIGPE